MTDFQLERMDTPYGIEIIILNEINRSQRKKLKKKISKNLFTLSKGGINDEFFEDAFSDSEILIIGKDSDKNGNLHSIRGFALIQVDKSQYEYLYLALLCCAERPTVKTRQNTTSFRGTDFISLLKCFCINNYYQGITLYSLHQVMTYYYKYGWKLQTRTDTKYNLRGYDIHNLKEFRETMDTYDYRRPPELYPLLALDPNGLPACLGHPSVRQGNDSLNPIAGAVKLVEFQGHQSGS